MKQSPPQVANLFMLFLFSYNVLLSAGIRFFYWEFWHGTDIGLFVRSPWMMVLNQVLGLLLPFFIFTAISEPVPIAKRPLGLFNILLIIVISLLLQPYMMLISGLTSLLIPNPVIYVLSDMALLPIPVALFVIAFTPAICEELVFRGFIQARYESYHIAASAIVNGLFFGIIHMNLHQFSYAFVMGVIFALMVHFTRSIFSAILSHFIVNAAQFGLAFANSEHLGSPDQNQLMEAIIAVARIALFILPVLIIFVYIFITHNNRKEREMSCTETRV